MATSTIGLGEPAKLNRHSEKFVFGKCSARRHILIFILWQKSKSSITNKDRILDVLLIAPSPQIVTMLIIVGGPVYVSAHVMHQEQ